MGAPLGLNMRIVRHRWPSIWRAVVYFLMAALPVWQEELSGLVQDHSMPQLCAAEWLSIALSSVIAGLTALRAFFDGTNERLNRAELLQNETKK